MALSIKTPIGAAQSAHPRVVLFVVMIGASVFHLRAWGRPADIAWKVSSIIINSIERMSRRSFADICQEVFESAPASTDFDASGAVVLIAYDIWVFTSAAHHAPGSIEWMKVSDSGEAMSQIAYLATAGSGAAFLKASRGCNFVVSAIAFAEPQHIASAVSASGWFECDQSTKSLTCKIYRWSSDRRFHAIGLFGHRAAPTVRDQVVRLVVPTLASLRTIPLAAERS